MVTRTCRTVLTGWIAITTTSSLLGADWPQWRGPALNGSSLETGLPASFSKDDNVKWASPMPGPSAATPIVWNDHVFVSSTDTRAQTLVAMALDRKTGQALWSRKVADGLRRDDRSDFASPSPVTDGQRAIFYYGNGDLAAFDFAGKPLWQRNLQEDEGEFATLWTYSTSPLLHAGRLYVQVLQRDVPVNGRGRTGGPIDSYLLILNPADGKTLKRIVRPSKARAESREAFTTPIPAAVGGKVELLVAGGDCLTGHDPQSGMELWRWGTYNPTRVGHWRLVPSPVPVNGLAVLCAPKGAPIYAIKLGNRGTLSDSAVVWESTAREISSDVATPLVYRDRLFVLNGERKTLARLDPATGQPDWIGDLGTRVKIESSPTAGDGKIYFQDHNATVFVVSAGNEFEILHQVAMGGDSDRDSRSSIALSGGNLFLRTAARLYCIGE